MMKNFRSNPKRYVFSKIIRLLALFRLYRLLVKITNKFISPVAPLKHGEDVFTVLVLNKDSFRCDLELFAESENLNILSIETRFLRGMLCAFVNQAWLREKNILERAKESRRLEFFNVNSNLHTKSERLLFRSFLRKFLPLLYDKHGIQAVITQDLRFRRQADIVCVSSELGYPHLLFQRESMFTIESIFNLVSERLRLIGDIRIDAVAVQNEITKKMFLASGSIDREKIHIIGCPRMDAFLLKCDRPLLKKEINIVVFAPPDHVAGEFTEIQGIIAPSLRTAARALQQIEGARMKIKLKDFKNDAHHQERKKRYENYLKDIFPNIPSSIEFVTDRMAAHDLIFESTVVIAAQSTVVLEAAIAGKRVILPHFSFLRNIPGSDNYLLYRDICHLFDVPDDEEQMLDMILDAVKNPRVNEDIMSLRRDVFGHLVSNLNGNATKQGMNLIIRTIRQSKHLK